MIPPVFRVGAHPRARPSEGPTHGSAPTRNVFCEFRRAIDARVARGREVYGNLSIEREPDEIVRELSEEAEDLVGWSKVLVWNRQAHGLRAPWLRLALLRGLAFLAWVTIRSMRSGR